MKILTICAIGVTLGFSAGVSFSAQPENGRAIPMATITARDLPGDFAAVIPEGIDISPNGSKVAVLFEVVNRHLDTEIWAGIWQLSPFKLLADARVDGPLSQRDRSNPQFVRGLRFSPDGGVLVLQSGPRIQIVDAQTLATQVTVEPPAIVPVPRYGVAIRSFDISADAQRLVVLTEGVYDLAENAQIAVQVISLPGGKHLAEWQIPGRARHISVSPDGSRVALDPARQRTDVLIVDSLSGSILQKLHTGWLMGAGTMIFLDPDRIAMVPEIGTDEHGRFFGSGLKIFSAAKEELVSDINCSKFGSTGTLAAAGRAPLLATVGAYQTPKEVRSDTAIRKSKPELIVFRLTDDTCRSVLKPVPHGQFKSTLDQYSLRLSADGQLVALLEDDVGKVYRLPA